MNVIVNKSLRYALALLSVTATYAHAADKLFAAPATGDSASDSASGSAGHVTLALAVVLICVFAAAWVLQKLRKIQTGPQSDIKILSQVALGAKERAVLLQVKNVQLLVGVAAHQVSTLHVFATVEADKAVEVIAPAAVDPTQAIRPTFQAILKRSLGLS